MCGRKIASGCGAPALNAAPDAVERAAYHPPSGPSGSYSADFAVVASNEQPSPTGTKYLVFQNGARVAFTLTGGALPTSSTPSVPCSVGAGYPLLIACNYDSSIDQCYYVVTFMDQTQWTLYPAVYTGAGQLLYCLTHLQDRVGNGLNFIYGPASVYLEMFMTGGIPLLSSINCASTGNVLLTFLRDAKGCIIELQDCYGRSVYYSNNLYYSYGSLGDYQHYLLTQVSQISATGTGSGSAAMRYEYDYTTVYNGFDGVGLVLSTITVPSPTGSGTSTATIAYQPATCYVSTITDANGNVTTFTPCSSTGVPVSDGDYTASSYTLVSVANSEGTVVYSTIGGFDGNMSDVSATDGAGNVAYSRTFASPTNPFRPDSVSDGTGHTAYYTWDMYGNRLSETSTRGTVTTYTVDYSSFALGRTTSIQEGSKTATTMTYFEPSGLLETINQPTPGTSSTGSTVSASFTYDSLGNMLTAVMPGNNSASTLTTTFGYTTDGSYSQSAALNQILIITNSMGYSCHMRYDDQGRCIAAWDASENAFSRTYGLSGQVLTEVLPATGQTGPGQGYASNTYQYVGGPLASMKLYNESGTLVRTITRAYGVEGELLSVAGSSEPVAYTYDALYRHSSLSDGNGNVTGYLYGAAGYLSQITLPGSSGSGHFDTVQFTSYNALGQLLQRIDGNGVITNYTYGDTSGSLSAIQYPATTSRNASFSYDEYGRLSSKTDGEASHVYTWDDRNKLTNVQTTYTGLSAQSISYSYYADSSRSGMTTPAGSFSYSYDGAGRLVGLTNPFSETTVWSWQENDWLSTQTLANGCVTSYGYNALGSLTGLLNQLGSGTSAVTLSQFGSFSYDGAGNRTGVTASVPAATSLDGTVTYSYDTKNQLTSETSTRGSGISTTFGFDSAGNPTTFQGASKSFNSDNQLTGTGLSYDGNGNPTSYGGASMTFDAENKLTAAGSLMTAGYTIEGLRAWKQNTSSGVRTYFLYDGTTPVVELTSSGSVSATNTFGANGLLSRNVSGSGSIFYTFDERGNVAQRLSSSGSMLSTDLYSAFGTLLAGGGDVFGFGGKAGYYTDIETGFVLCTFRCYDPINGRWITRDPASYSGGINLYGYCQNMVVSGMDPSGKGIGLIVGLGPLLAVLCSLACQQMSNEDGDPCEIDQCTTICDEIAETAQIASCLVLMFLPPPVDMAAVITCILIAIAGLMKLNLDMTGEAHHCGCPFANTSVVSATPAGNPVTPSLA